MISYCVDIDFDDFMRRSSTIIGDFEYEHYVRAGRRSSTEIYYLTHPELQFIAIF